MTYEAVIGLEVHAQLKTATKIFCGCPTDFGAGPNDHVCPICLGMPGVLPVLNERAVELAVRAGIALNCKIAPVTRFDRKNYFYADLPKGYQISQLHFPICQTGHLNVDGKRIRINRAHLEEDAGKLVHAGAEGLHGSNYSLVDFNRSGVPLLEIVTEPDLSSPDEAKQYLTELRNILRYIEVCDGNLEEGSFRCDANVSLRPEGQKELGTKTEIKNMNSFRAVQRAIQSEIERQEAVLSSGGRITQETRLWNDAEQKTHPMRSKEEAHDYRYFPEPDLVPLEIEAGWIDEIAKSLPELPEARRTRYSNELGIAKDDAQILAEAKDMSDFFDHAVKAGTPAKYAANFLINWTSKFLKDKKTSFAQTKATAENFADLASALDKGTLGSTNAQKLLEFLLEEGGNVQTLIEEKGLAQLSDEDALKTMLKSVLERSEKQVEEYRSGKTKIRQYFFGEMMKETKGKGDPKVINQLLDQLLPEPASN